jgi:cytochrome c-type biogenesis protein CcmE
VLLRALTLRKLDTVNPYQIHEESAMAEATLERPQTSSSPRIKFLVGGLVILLAVGYLIVSSFGSSAQYFLTVAELHDKGSAIVGDDVRVSGVVIGDSIRYDARSLHLEFDVVDSLNDLSDPLHVVYVGPKPDLMKHEAQAIVEGVWGEDGVFYAHDRADSLLLKCPTRYEDDYPEQVEG